MRRRMLRSVLLISLVLPAARVSADAVPEKPIQPADRQHWSFQPPRRPAVPTVKQPSWVRTPVDAYILYRLEEAGLTPTPPAERLALLRRVYLDLVGLPPSPEEQDAFLADSSPGAYEKMLDRLLA